ncbi:ABC transporter ATP-binding protein [Mycoplasma nasistruthionis]|uniref:ABC transporter ATP-binding protein n=1 Tax=Mycoplasma nasistruthionis TaxID=353852 RepID=A0A5B7XUN3_9MOLU|nr:ABC transporter ATP-binding protein [Mycoplasma nasistruthionis]QCZ36437.1 ABC transporter ATP-binding protein [Mycoplasma nasistruthionis]
MLKLFKILPKNVKHMFLLGVIIIILNVALTMILPVLLNQFLPLMISNGTKANGLYEIEIFNTTMLSGSWNKVFYSLLTCVLLILFFAVLTSFLGILIIVWAGEKASNFYRDALFKKYQKLSLKDISQLSTESLITRINDDVAVFWDFLVGASTALIRAPLFIIVGLIFAFLTDLSFTVAIIAVIPLLVFIMGFIFIKAHPLIQKNRKNLDLITKEADESINGARFIKANNLQEKQLSKFSFANQNWLKNEKKIFGYFVIGAPCFFMIVNLIVVFIYAMGYGQLSENIQSNAQLIAKLNVFIEFEFLIGLGILMFSMFLGSFFRGKISAGRIVEVLEHPYDDLFVKEGQTITENDANDATSYSVEFKNVNYKYFNSSEDYSIKDINFKIEGKQTLGIIGPTGSGKSTIANLLVNNMKYTEGNILINGKEVNQLNTQNLHKNVAIVYQEALLYSGTIKSNILFANPKASNQDVEKALKASCAYDFVKTFSDRLDHPVVQGGKNLSGGQKQRLSIARSLLNDPKLLILDDSTSALDNITTKQLIKNIKNDYDCTTIIISQKINSIKHADKILVMVNGEILAQGTHQELLKTCQWYADINHNQLEQ